MKYIAVIIPFIVLVSGQEDDEHLQLLMNFHTECKAATGIADSVVTGAMLGHFPDDPALKQHLFCMSKKLGLQDDAGQIHKDIIKEKLNLLLKDSDKVDKIVETCAVQKDTPEQTAFEMAKCYHKTAHVH